MIYPAPAAAALAGAGAPVALFVAVFAPAYWPLGLVWIVVVTLLVAADVFLAADRQKMTLELHTQPQAHIGSPVEATAEVMFGSGARPPNSTSRQLWIVVTLRPWRFSSSSR